MPFALKVFIDLDGLLSDTLFGTDKVFIGLACLQSDMLFGTDDCPPLFGQRAGSLLYREALGDLWSHKVGGVVYGSGVLLGKTFSPIIHHFQF